MPEPHSPTFELGLVMAGAISGGAYAAGVLDFLIQALDAWEAAKVPGAEVPRHRVLIPVMSGASAGAMAAAIATVSFGSETRPVTDVAAPPAPELNRLYDAWVRRIDIPRAARAARSGRRRQGHRAARFHRAPGDRRGRAQHARAGDAPRLRRRSARGLPHAQQPPRRPLRLSPVRQPPRHPLRHVAAMPTT